MRCRDGGLLEHELKTAMPLAEITGLRSGCLYRFRVQAFNEVGLLTVPCTHAVHNALSVAVPMS